MKKAALFLIRLPGAIFCIPALFDLFNRIFEYGEWFADLSHLEIAFFLIILWLERRSLKRVREANGSVAGLLFKQAAYYGWAAFILTGILFAINDTPEPSLRLLGLLLLSVIHGTTPRRPSPPAIPEVAA